MGRRLFKLLILLVSVLFLGTAVQARKFYAGDIFALDIWKLTIPLDDNTDDDGFADEVKMPVLRRFEDPDFFWLSKAGDSIVFRARCGDPTTKNSMYPRCELREMKPGGEEKASWGTNDGMKHTLAATLSVNAVPAVKKAVSCIQIHDAEGDFLQIRLSGNKLFIKREGADPVILNENYKMGERFSFIMVIEKGSILYLHEGKQLMKWEIEKKNCYFKAGCNTLSNPEKGDRPDSYGEVEIEKLYVVHKKADAQ